MKKIIGLVLLLAMMIGAFIGYNKYDSIYTPNVPEELADKFLVIPTGSTKCVLGVLRFNRAGATVL